MSSIDYLLDHCKLSNFHDSFGMYMCSYPSIDYQDKHICHLMDFQEQNMSSTDYLLDHCTLNSCHGTYCNKFLISNSHPCMNCIASMIHRSMLCIPLSSFGILIVNLNIGHLGICILFLTDISVIRMKSIGLCLDRCTSCNQHGTACMLLRLNIVHLDKHTFLLMDIWVIRRCCIDYHLDQCMFCSYYGSFCMCTLFRHCTGHLDKDTDCLLNSSQDSTTCNLPYRDSMFCNSSSSPSILLQLQIGHLGNNTHCHFPLFQVNHTRYKLNEKNMYCN